MTRNMSSLSLDQRIALALASTEQLRLAMLQFYPDWVQITESARNITMTLHHTGFMDDQNRTAEQIWVVTKIQHVAFHDADTGCDFLLATWCQQGWESIIEREPRNHEAIRWKAKWWFCRARPILKRIDTLESPSSSDSSTASAAENMTAAEFDAQQRVAFREAEARTGTADFVEARMYLQASVDCFEHSLDIASTEIMLTGPHFAEVYHQPYTSRSATNMLIHPSGRRSKSGFGSDI